MKFAGEIAALGTAACWSAAGNLYVAAGRRIGPASLNRLRLTAATLMLGAALVVVKGTPWPGWASHFQIAMLAASGLVGFVFGDTFNFRALVILGPGRASLLASLAPLFTVAVSWLFLHEHPGPLALAGMALTIGGVAWVLGQRATHDPSQVHGSVAFGIVAGIIAAMSQACSYVLSRSALKEGLDPLSATVIRITTACVGIWIVAMFQGAVSRTLAALRDRRATTFMLGGAFTGEFAGVTLSLAALQFIQAGVASSLIATVPIPTLLLSAWFHKEPLTWRTLAGAVIAIAGVVVLFLR